MGNSACLDHILDGCLLAYFPDDGDLSPQLRRQEKAREVAMKDELQLKAHRLDSFAITSLQCEDKFGLEFAALGLERR
jgi:hypothetical protein